MSDDKNVKVDPRFDPAFQRGFDQSIPIDEYVPDPVPRTPTTPAAPVVAPSTVVVPSALPVVTAPAAAPEVVASDSPVDETARTVVENDAEVESAPSRNPFLLLLVVIAIALVAVGVWLFVRTGDAFNSREVQSQGDYMSLDATIHMAPFIALLGAATAIGVLFVFATKWRSRR